MIKIENPIHRIIALCIDTVCKIIYYCGEFLELWHIEKHTLKDINPQKILIIEEEPLGDVVMSTAIYPYIRKRYPAAKIAVMTGNWAKDVLLHNPYIDEVIVQNCPWAFSDIIITKKALIKHLKYFLTYPSILKKLRKKKYNLCIDLRGDFRNILLFMVFTGIKHKLTFDKRGAEYLLTQSIPFERDRHEVEKNFDLIECLGIERREKQFFLYPSEKELRKLKLLLDNQNIKDGDKFCVIHPGARKKVRLWPLDRYGYVADFLFNKYQAKVIFTGVREESYLIEAIIKDMGNKNIAIDLSGKLTVLELAALLKRAFILICPDTSIAHIASVFFTPTVVLFGPQNSDRTKPYQKNAYVVDKRFFCRPCLRNKCNLSKNGYSACMDIITVEDVKYAIDNLIDTLGKK